MYAVSVLPIQRGAFKEPLTFFAREAVPVGSVVSAPIRKRMVQALVTNCADIRDAKLDLKNAGYALKKLGIAVPKQLFSAQFMAAIKDIARYHIADEGTVLAHITFADIVKSPRSLEAPAEIESPRRGTKPEVLILQAEPDARFLAYRNLVRECFARQKSVMVIAPSLIEVEHIGEVLSRGIEDRIIILTSALTPRERKIQWNKISDHRAPVVIVGTPAVLSAPRTDLDVVVIERESARAYRARTRPHLDFRRAAEYVADRLGIRLILADYPVRAETRYRTEQGLAEDVTRPQLRPAGRAQVTLIDVRAVDTMKSERRTFSTLAPESIDAIRAVIKSGGRVAVYAARRGIAPLTVCNDCGTPITDPATGTPMILHKTPKGNVFLSHRSGAILPAEIHCAICGGWNLVTLGIGVDRVYNDLKKALPDVTLLLFTKDTVPTYRAAQKVSQALKSRGTIIVGTERMLPYLTEPVTLSVVASIDSLLSSTAWRAHEQALSILFYLQSRSTDELRIETRHPQSSVMTAIASGNVQDFYRDEINERRLYGYPPFVTFIGISWSGTASHCERLRALVSAKCVGTDLVGPLPPEQVDRNRFVEHAVIRVPANTWPDDALIDMLNGLPQDITVTVDPDDIV